VAADIAGVTTAITYPVGGASNLTIADADVTALGPMIGGLLGKNNLAAGLSRVVGVQGTPFTAPNDVYQFVFHWTGTAPTIADLTISECQVVDSGSNPVAAPCNKKSLTIGP
jgi:hypothetical protein